jgi:para-nitrobenzyl esterase
MAAKLTVLISGLLLLMPLQGVSAPTERPIVTIDSGRVQGQIEEGVLSFKGIPYARPPVRQLRWRAPQAVPKWSGVRFARTFGPDCTQVVGPTLDAPRTTPSEDCLYVNVWTPNSTPKKPMPVMVWIYGGGFAIGSTSASIYDGTSFAKQGIVLVSLNYRIGRFGFFAHPALTREAAGAPTGNFALLDHIAALRWVHRNAAAFGGDPSNITVFGESAGGAAIHMLIASPMAAGLFGKAIIESGPLRWARGSLPLLHREGPGTGVTGEEVGVLFAKTSGVTDEGDTGLAALRQLPADRIRGNENLFALLASPTFVGPMIDGRILTRNPAESYQIGAVSSVPMIIGATSADGFPSAGALTQLFARFGSKIDQARALYNPENSSDSHTVSRRVNGDLDFIEPVRFVAQAMSRLHQHVYVYRLSYVAESMRNQSTEGALHFSDVPYVFDTVRATIQNATPLDFAMSRTIQDYWVAFAKTGDPSGNEGTLWPKYDPNTDVIMSFTADGKAVAIPDPLKTRLDLAASVTTTTPE